MEHIKNYFGTQFTSKEFQEVLSVRGVIITLETLDHHDMNCQVEVKCRTLRTITYSIMFHTWVSNKYIHFSLIYTTYYIFPVLPIKHLIN